jgi:hypothetical protein
MPEDLGPHAIIHPSLRDDPSPTTTAFRAVALTVSALFVGLGIHFRDGEYMSPSGAFYPPIWCIGVALAAAAVAVRPPTRLRLAGRLDPGELALAALMLAVVTQFALLLRGPPSGWNPWSNDLRDESVANLRLYYGGLTLAAGLTLALFVARRWFWVFPFAGVLGVHLFLGFWLVRSCPNPDIDVWHFQQIGGRALLAGQNPYTATYPDIYAQRTARLERAARADNAGNEVDGVGGGRPATEPTPATRPAYGEHLTTGTTLKFGFPYPPASLFLSTLGLRFGGDHRYAQAVALTLSGLLIAAARPGRWGALSALLLLFTPRAFFVLGRGWTEPFVVLHLSLTLFVACRLPRLFPIALALGLFLASKQYLVFAVPLAWLLVPAPRDRRRAAWLIGVAVLVALAVTAPLALWDVRAFVVSTFTAQADAPFREDALSWLVWFYDRTGVKLGAWAAFALALAALVACLRYCPRSPAGFATGLLAVYLPFIAFNKQAFANYYLFVISAAACALGLLRPEKSSPAPLRARSESVCAPSSRDALRRTCPDGRRHRPVPTPATPSNPITGSFPPPCADDVSSNVIGRPS